jgi:formylglycine-generating enzyme required for sulfatase activity
MKKVFILLGFALLGGGSFGEVLSNGPANGNAYECRVYHCNCISVPIEMVFVQGGTLQNKNTSGTRAVGSFYIGKYEVTQKQWKDVMGTTIQDMWKTAGYGDAPMLQGVGDNYPMYCVSWNDAQAFISALNAGGGNFRLPTEVEWEYAAKGGNPQQSYNYAGSNTADDVAWHSGNASSTTHPVNDNVKAANDIGAYHMSGNVWEWCQDYYGGSYGESAIPAKTPTSGSWRVIRGGSEYNGTIYCTVSYRINGAPNDCNNNYGFRLVCRSNP